MSKHTPPPKHIPRPTDAELDILNILWQHGASTVRAVNDALNKRHAPVPSVGDSAGDSAGKTTEEAEIGYTTTLKIMQIMTEKGLVSRDESSRTHIYTANVQESAIQRGLVARLVDTAFRGSALKLAMQALGQSTSSQAELTELRRLLDEKEQELQTQQDHAPAIKKGRKL